LTWEQNQEVEEAFDIFDYHKTGTLDLHEVKVLIRALGFSVKRTEVPRMVHLANPDCGNTVDLDTFKAVVAGKYAALDPQEEIKKAFHLFDDDGTGKITMKNLRRVTKELGEDIKERELQAMIDEFDKDQDGDISLDEFVVRMEGRCSLL
ncbi:unnamed protein product, partial [Discosporangium mesarthrocarpum]